MNLIFDLDGTLLNTIDDLWASVNHALAQYSLPSRSISEIRQFLGNGIASLVHKSMPTDDAELESRVFATFRDHYMAHSLDHTRPYDGITDMLRQCKVHGHRTAIVSNKTHAAVQELHQRFFTGLIDTAIGEQPDIPRKPAPDMVHLAMHQLGATPDTSVYIGDSEVDLATARNAHLPCISVAWGFRDEPFLIQQGAAPIIHNPNELLSILQQFASS